MIALIDYGAGNTASVANALEELKQEFVLTFSEDKICASDKIIFPGVGQASFAVRQLHRYNLINLLRIIKKPLLGICLGMQLLADHSTEGNVACLGAVPGEIKKFDSSLVIVPHMGWNEVTYKEGTRLFRDIKQGEFFYFAHSYYHSPNEYTIAESSHGIQISAAIEKGNYFGVQFHPEKSGSAGLKLLQNFIEL